VATWKKTKVCNKSPPFSLHVCPCWGVLLLQNAKTSTVETSKHDVGGRLAKHDVATVDLYSRTTSCKSNKLGDLEHFGIVPWSWDNRTMTELCLAFGALDLLPTNQSLLTAQQYSARLVDLESGIDGELPSFHAQLSPFKFNGPF
jgi:hypothetical protein